MSNKHQHHGSDEDETATSSLSLQASNSRVSLTLTAPHRLGDGPTFAVGSTIRPRVRVHAADKRDKSPYSSLALRLVGQAKATIMGKDRWQAAQIVNASAGGGPAMPVTSQEKITFIDVEIPLVSPAQVVPSSSEMKKGRETGDSGIYGGMYELRIPEAGDNQLLPTHRPAKFTNDLALVGVKYELQLAGKRPGFLKLDDKFHRMTYLSKNGQSADKEPLPKVSIVLNRRLTTSPVENPNRGKQDFRWASICIQKPVKLETKEPSDGMWIWYGDIQVPPEERTVLSKGLSIEVSLAMASESSGDQSNTGQAAAADVLPAYSV
ncbi:hypothetical protein OIV83_002654 [Microbotryomycetes sp. JL201]|nr:hypothetical protein OIV83_002654 [Microbotryomycetes sp. JL201]